VAIISPHGGKIEPGASDLARAIAENDYYWEPSDLGGITPEALAAFFIEGVQFISDRVEL
jgi:hypothetical protein